MNIALFEEKRDLFLKKLNREIDMDWQEISEHLGLDWSSSHTRKVAYGIKEYHEYVQLKGLDNIAQDLKEQLIKQELEIKKQKVQMSDLRSEINRQVRELSRFESMINLSKELSSKLNLDKPFLTKKKIFTSGKKEAVLLLSDLHIGIVNNNYWNKYDTDIMIERMKFLRSRVIKTCIDNEVKKIHLCLLGDIVSGIIHSTIRLENRENIVKQSLIASEVLSELIYELSKIVDVELHFTVGNHGRVSANKNDSLDSENFEYFIREMIKLRCQEIENFSISKNIIDEEISTFKIFNDYIVATHGDKFGNINSYIPKITSLVGEIPSYICIGHLHNHFENAYGNTELIVNPSFSGVDTYAKNLGLIGRPSQKLIIFSEEYGKESTHQIYLDKIE